MLKHHLFSEIYLVQFIHITVYTGPLDPRVAVAPLFFNILLRHMLGPLDPVTFKEAASLYSAYRSIRPMTGLSIQIVAKNHGNSNLVIS